jgi:hypothetical protein
MDNDLYARLTNWLNEHKDNCNQHTRTHLKAWMDMYDQACITNTLNGVPLPPVGNLKAQEESEHDLYVYHCKYAQPLITSYDTPTECGRLGNVTVKHCKGYIALPYYAGIVIDCVSREYSLTLGYRQDEDTSNEVRRQLHSWYNDPLRELDDQRSLYDLQISIYDIKYICKVDNPKHAPPKSTYIVSHV